MIQAILFDYGGVLDFDPEKMRGREAAASMLNLAYPELRKRLFGGQEWHRAQLGEISTQEFWESVLSSLGLTTTDSQQQFIKTYFGEHYGVNSEMFELVRRLKTKFRIGILSNASDFLRGHLERLGLVELFDFIICSAEVGWAKPDPRIFEFAIARLKVAPQECLLIDNDPASIQAARVIGMRTILFHSVEQLKTNLVDMLNLDTHSID